MRIEPDGWLSEIFGHDVFRITLVNPEVLRAAAASRMLPPHPSQTSRAFYYAKVPAVEIGAIHNLTRLGFRIVDVHVTFSRKPASVHQASPIRVDDVQPGQVEAVLDIAETCFIYSRFHQDPLVSPRLANRIKREWITNYTRKMRGEALLVAELDGVPVGFLAILGATHAGQLCKVIDLMGVHRGYQGRGAGRALVESFVTRYAGVAEWLRVGTQVANVPSMRLYENCGFRVEETAYMLHRHSLDGVVL
jgi:ribosomal protein S18 acetylase RimI-like enzyme